MPQKEKPALAGPGQYNVFDAFSDRSIYRSSSRFTIGVGRENMKTMFVDEIQKEANKKRGNPSPQDYTLKQTFGKDGIHYSGKGRHKRYGTKMELGSPYYYRL